MSVSNIILNLIVNGNNQARQQLTDLTVSVGALSATFTALGKVVSDVSSQFNKSLTNLQSITNITDAQVKKLGDSIKELSGLKNVGDTALELSKAIGDLAGNGFENLTTNLKIATIAGQAAAAGNVKTADSVRLLSGIMNSYNTKTARDAAEYSDKLFTIVGRGSVKFEELANNMSQLLPIASSTGIKIDDLGGAIIRMSQTSMPMAQIETALSGLLRSIAGASPEIKALAKNMGVDLSEEALKNGLVPMMEQLNKATGGSLELIKKLIPDTEAANAAMVLMADGADLLKTEVVAMGEGVGSATKALDVQTKSYAFQVSKLNSDLENLKITFGDILNQALIPFIEQVREGIKFISNLDQSTKEIIINTALFVTGLGAAGLALGGLVLALTPVISTLGLVFTSVGSLLMNFRLLSVFIGAGGAFGLAVTLAISTVWALKKIIDGIIEGFNMIQAIAAAKTANAENEKTLKNALSLAAAYQRLSEAQKKALNIDELKEYSNAFAVLASYANDKESKDRNRSLAIDLNERSKNLEKLTLLQRDTAAKNKDLAIKTAKENAKIAEEANKKQKELDEENKRKRKQADEEYKAFQLKIVDDVLRYKLSSMDYELAQVKKKRDEDLKLARNKDDRNKIEFVYQQERKKILDEYAKVEQQKQQELYNKTQKINDDITKYVAIETKKRQDIEKKKQDEIKKALEKEAKEREKIEKESLELQEKYSKEALELTEKEFKEATEIYNQELENRQKLQEYYQGLLIGSINSSSQQFERLGDYLQTLDNEMINSLGQLSSFIGKYTNQISFAMVSTENAIQSAIDNVFRSLESMFSNFDKQNKSFDTYNQAVAQFGKDSQEAKDAILTVNEGISDSFRALPGVIGEPLAQLTRMFTDFIGLTESAAEKTKKALDTANFKKLLDNLLAETNKVIEASDQLKQLDIDNIEDEKTRKEAQLNYDISIIEKSSKFEAVKIAEIKKLKSEYAKWLNEYNKDLNDKAIKENEDNIKKIRDTNEANYKSELSIIDKFYGEKRRKLEQDVQKEIDIIQSKNDRLKAIDDERTQTDADKKKRLQSFNQSLTSSNRTADFYRSNVEDFEVGFGGISNQRKLLEADYQAGNINYEVYAKKRTEIGLKQFQYYTEQSKRISDPKEKQEAIDKATQGQQEYYDFIFDKEKEKVENETRQAQIRLDSKRIELAKITEIEKQEIAKLDQAYKDSSGLYKDSFVNATQVWVKFAQDSINDIDLSNLINKVKNDINQAKQELGLVSAKTGTGTTNTPVTTSKSGYSTGGQVGPLLPDGAFYSKDSSFNKSLQTTNTSQIRPMRDEKSEQQKKNELISKLVVNPMFGYSFDNYINQSLSWLENQAIRLGIPLMAKGGVTNGLSIAGEAGSEAIYNYSQMKDMYDFVKRTTSNSNSNYNNSSNSINIVYNPVFTGVDLAKSGQVDNMIKSNLDSLKRDIIKASGGR